MKRFFSRRAFVWLLASLIPLYALFVIIENHTGTRALAAAQAKVLREGESLDFTTHLPALPPALENFCAIEPLIGIKDPNTESSDALKALAPAIPTSLIPDPLKTGKAPDSKPLIAHLASLGIGNAQATPAEGLAALDAAHPLLRELANAAPQRPLAQFIPIPGESWPNICAYELKFNHFTHSQRLSAALLLRSHLAIAADNPSEAIKSIQASLRLANAHLQEPVLLSLLVGTSTLSRTTNAVWHLLHARIANQTELATLRDDIARIDLPKAMLQASRGELAIVSNTLTAYRLIDEHPPSFLAANQDPIHNPSTATPGEYGLHTLIPNGFHQHSEARLIIESVNHLILPMKSPDFQFLAPLWNPLQDRIQKNRQLTRPHHWQAALHMETVSRQIARVAEVETQRRHALAALTIESIRQTQGTLPSTLPPGHLNFIDGKPTHYQVEGKSYRLSSTSIGNLNPTETPAPDQSKTTSQTQSKDWTWQMPATD
jgi:hypothetical protein